MQARTIIFTAVLLSVPSLGMAQSEPAPPAPEAPELNAATADARALVAALEAKYARVEAQRKSQPQVATATEASANPTSTGLEMMALALVLGGALGAATWWLRRRQRVQAVDPNSANLAVSDALWLGKGQRLVLVDVAGRRVLLGVSSVGMQSLAVLDGAVAQPREAPAPAKIKTTAFPESEEWFSEMVKDELVRDRPTRDDRRRILSQLNSL